MRKLAKKIKEGALFAAAEGLIFSKKKRDKNLLWLCIQLRMYYSYYLQFAEIFFVLWNVVKKHRSWSNMQLSFLLIRKCKFLRQHFGFYAWLKFGDILMIRWLQSQCEENYLCTPMSTEDIAYFIFVWSLIIINNQKLGL